MKGQVLIYFRGKVLYADLPLFVTSNWCISVKNTCGWCVLGVWDNTVILCSVLCG